MTILMLIGMVFVIIRDVPLEDTFKLCAYTAASDFYEWVQVEIDVYIPHCKYQANPHSSPSFSGACAAVIVHRNHFFLYQQNTSSESKVKFRKASHCCKTVLEAAKLAYATKTTSLPRNMALMTYFTADLLTVVSDRIAGAFNKSGATQAAALDISKSFDRVWHAGLLHKPKS